MITKSLLQVAILLPILVVLLLVPAGQYDWAMGWVFLGSYLTGIFFSALLPVFAHRDLAVERREPPPGAKSWDKRLLDLYYLFSLVLTLPLAGLDKRFGWSPPMHIGVQLVAMIPFLLGYVLSCWAMAVNPFFSALVRIQEDRGHRVITSGPYRFVRHPAYLGWITTTLTSALVLGSLWALIPAACAAAVLVVRTILEDRTLVEELDGYGEYANQVRYRLLPGIW
jgi:protein-S-isoprenylcysteine O-methyltransferase Ste14